MKQKSKYIFLIMCIVYIFIGILNYFDLVPININVLFGLSLSSLFMSISDIFSNFIIKISSQNELNLLVKRTSEFVDSKLNASVLSCNPIILTSNVKKDMERRCPKFKKAVVQNELNEKFYMDIFNRLKYIFFLVSLAIFIIVPFIEQNNMRNEKITVIITIFAFASMCYNLFISEQIEDIAKIRLDFSINAQTLISLAYPDYQTHLFNLDNG